MPWVWEISNWYTEKIFSQAATAAASAAVSLATQSGIAVASASGLVQGSLVGSHNAGYNNNKIRSEIQMVAAFEFSSQFLGSTSGTGVWSSCSTTTERPSGKDRLMSSTMEWWWLTDPSGGWIKPNIVWKNHSQQCQKGWKHFSFKKIYNNVKKGQRAVWDPTWQAGGQVERQHRGCPPSFNLFSSSCVIVI